MNPHVEAPILTAGLFDYAKWRAERLQRVRSLLAWLDDRGLLLEQSRTLLKQQIARLGNDRMTVAFVAEFSRGKTELINAMFFSGHGQRILPAGAGRTTMCPMELFSDATQPRGLRLLPISTRLQPQTLAQWKASPQVWTQVDLPSQDAHGLAQALTHLSDTQRVPLERAQELGFFHDAGAGADPGGRGWRGGDSAVAACPGQLPSPPTRSGTDHPRHPWVERRGRRTRTDPFTHSVSSCRGVRAQR